MFSDTRPPASNEPLTRANEGRLFYSFAGIGPRRPTAVDMFDYPLPNSRI
jgi:hypothetical protein